jgi:hypothetical protein
MIVIVLLSRPAEDALAKTDDGNNPAGQKAAISGAGATAWTLTFGVVIGVVLMSSMMAAVIMPPAYLLDWTSAREPLADRAERALHPQEHWVALRSRERDASERAIHAESEFADATKRLADAESALSRARDELGTATANTVRGIRINQGTGSRHANGAVYIGVELALPNSGYCITHASSDKADDVAKRLYVGEAISLATSRGRYRVVAMGISPANCTFDLVQE